MRLLSQAGQQALTEWVEPALPNGSRRTYLSAGGAAIVAATFLLFLSLLVAYIASSTSWAPW